MKTCTILCGNEVQTLHFRHYLPPNDHFVALMLHERSLLEELPEMTVPPHPSHLVHVPGVGRKRYGSFQMDRAQKMVLETTAIGIWLKERRWGKVAKSGIYEQYDGEWLFGLSLRFNDAEASKAFAQRVQTLALASSMHPPHHWSWLQS